MKIFHLHYKKDNIEGLATIEAESEFRANQIFNEWQLCYKHDYNITSLAEIGCNDNTKERIVSNIFKDTSVSDTPTEPVEPSNPEEPSTPIEPVKFDINSLSDEDIEKLKLRINKHTGTIYVDRIGSTKSFRTHKKEFGHTVFCTEYRESHTYSDKKNLTGTFYLGIYQRQKDGSYTYLGYPYGYKYIESSRRRVYLPPVNNYVKNKISPTRVDAAAANIIYSNMEKLDKCYCICLRKHSTGKNFYDPRFRCKAHWVVLGAISNPENFEDTCRQIVYQRRYGNHNIDIRLCPTTSRTVYKYGNKEFYPIKTTKRLNSDVFGLFEYTFKVKRWNTSKENKSKMRIKGGPIKTCVVSKLVTK